jgi:hypothetical protein
MKNPPRFLLKPKASQLIKWHRRIGISAAVFVLILAVTGIALNHTTELALDKRHINSPLILGWYGIELPDQPRHFQAGGHIVSQLGDQLFIDGTAVLHSNAPLTGGATTPMFIAVAQPLELLLFTPTNELVERISALPGQIDHIDKIGLTADQTIAVSDGNTIMVADADMLTWQTSQSNQHIAWSIPVTPGDHFNNHLIAQYSSDTITYERLLLDLHSGRLFGEWGFYLMDAAAVLLILLAITGLWRWCQSKARR